jgi:hypothetical protein
VRCCAATAVPVGALPLWFEASAQRCQMLCDVRSQLVHCCCYLCACISQILAVLVCVLLVNVLLLLPALHAPGTAGRQLAGTPPFRGSGRSDGAGKIASSDQSGAADDGNSRSWQQRIAPGDFVAELDADGDGVLGPAELGVLLQEACRAERAPLHVIARGWRLLRLLLGRPASPGSPCGLMTELSVLRPQLHRHGAAAGAAGRAGSSSSGSGSSVAGGNNAAGGSGASMGSDGDTGPGACAPGSLD